MYKIKVKVEGLVPLMMHKYPMPDPDTGKLPPSSAKGKTAREAMIKGCMHMDKKGVFMPADNFKMILIGNQYRRGAAKIYGTEIKKNKATLITSQCEGYIWVTAPDGSNKIYMQPKRKTWDDTDIRSFITSKGGRDYTERPIMNPPWSFEFIIQVVDDNIEESFVRELYELAGLRCGIGAYGPTFGRFIVTEWEVIVDKKK